MKFKTVFCVRNRQLDSVMTAEWPEHLTPEAVKTLAKLRNEHPNKLLEELAPDAAALCSQYKTISMRARLNMMDGPYVVDSDHPPTDKELLAHWKGETNGLSE